MAIFALVSGVLHRDIEQRTSKTGKAFAAGTVRYADGEQQKFVRFTTFNADAINSLTSATAGDPVSVSGSVRIDVWQPDDGGAARANVNVLADKVLVRGLVEKKARPRPAPTAAQTYRKQARAEMKATGPVTHPDLNDELNF